MAAGIRTAMGLASLALIGGALVMMFFVVLSGVKDVRPLNKTYFLQADTSGFSGSGRSLSQWTYFYICGQGNAQCGAPVPALPFGYAWVGGSGGVPSSLVGSHGKGTTSTFYYYMWRFGWVTYLIALALTVGAFFTALLAPVSRLASGLSAMVLMSALFFFSVAAALMTATFVKARNVFMHNGLTASLGKYAFGFTWGAWAAMFLASVMLFVGCGLGGRHESTRSSSGGYFGRRRAKRANRGSFVETESQRRVKDEYA